MSEEELIKQWFEAFTEKYMRQIEQNNLKKEAAKRPKKIQRYSMMMLICIMIIYLVVLCTEVMSSLGAFFG